MTDGIDPEQALLSSIRQQLSPSSSDRARVGSRVAARIATGVLTPSLPENFDVPKALGSWPGLRGVGQQLIAASLLSAVTFGAGYLLGRHAPADVARVAAVSTQPAPRQAAPEPTPAPEALPSAEPQAPSVPSSKRQAPSASASTSTSAGQTLSEEARELRRVDSALRGGMPLLALGILNDLDRKIPRGALGEERAAARLIARCQNGDGGARSSAALWLEKNSRSVYATRVQASCMERPQ